MRGVYLFPSKEGQTIKFNGFNDKVQNRMQSGSSEWQAKTIRKLPEKFCNRFAKPFATILPRELLARAQLDQWDARWNEARAEIYWTAKSA